MTFDTPSWRGERDAKLLGLFGGNQSAVSFYVAVSTLCELWDDLTDRDKEIAQADVDAAFWSALITLPSNEFFNTHKAFFIPLIIQGINAWKDSVELEKGDAQDRAYALTLRNLGIQLVPMIVTVLRGHEAARQMSVDFWKWNTAHDDALAWINKKGQ
jgi:hypothetical protein